MHVPEHMYIHTNTCMHMHTHSDLNIFNNQKCSNNWEFCLVVRLMLSMIKALD